MPLQLKLFGEDLLDKAGNPIYNVDKAYISGGSKLYRYLGLANLLTNFNMSELIASTPFSYKPENLFITWNGASLREAAGFKQRLEDCFNSQSRFVIITLGLIASSHDAHANYILIDKGIAINESSTFTAIRIEPHGFCNTDERYNPIQLDEALTTYLRAISPKIVLLDETTTMPSQGPQILEVANRAGSCQIIPNTGLCATHSFILIYIFFAFITKQIPSNFYWLEEGGTPIYIDISKQEGAPLFSEIFTAFNMQFMYGGTKEWIEQLAIAVNQKLTRQNEVLLFQLVGMQDIGRTVTRSGESSDKLLKAILDMTSSTADGTCMDSSIDHNILNYFNYIIKNTNLSPDQLNQIFTIFGINYTELDKYAQSYPSSLPGGRKTRRRKSKKRRKKRRKTKRKRKSYKH